MGWIKPPLFYMELKLEELRVGNYLDYERTTHVVISIGSEYGGALIRTWWVDPKTNTPVIEKYEQDGSLNPYYDFLSHHEGIPITIEELKRLDLQYDENIINKEFGSNYDYIFYSGSVRIRFFEDEMTLYTQGDGIKSIVKIKYIHELQNLIYALYKKELIFKEIRR